jgi:beta-lactam-binding protein with PASTA domain
LRWVKWVVAVVILLGAAGTAAALQVRNNVYDHVVPRLTSLPLARAKQAAAHVDLVARETSAAWDAGVPAGYVIAQSLQAGRHERAHTVIGLEVSRGVEPVPIPSLAGDSRLTAIRTLTAGHLRHSLLYSYSETVRNGNVISWSPRGKDVAPNTKVVVWISAGPPPRPVPVVPHTDTFQQAQQLLASYGFKAVKDTAYSLSVGEGLVISTSPAHSAGSQAYGSVVHVTISLGPRSYPIPPLFAGETVGQATQKLKSLGFSVKVYGFGGTVVSEFPYAGTLVRQGTVVYLYSV